MEKCSDTCRFIFECKNLSSIIEPLRSRFLIVRVENPSLHDIQTVVFSFTKKYFDKELKKEEYEQIMEMAKYYQFNMKHIFGILVCYLTTGDFLRLSYVDKMKEIFDMIVSSHFRNEYFEKIKNVRMEYHNHKTKKSFNGEKLLEFLIGKGFKVEKFRKSSPYQGDLWLTRY